MNHTKILSKKCVICRKEFFRKPCYGLTLWKRRKNCSLQCKSIFLKKKKLCFPKGHKGYKNSGNFKKSDIPWNIGLHRKFNNALEIYYKNGGLRPCNKNPSEETRQKIRLARAIQKNIPHGKKHWNWKGGTSELRKKIQETNLYRNWRKQIFERDDYTCQHCYNRGGKLHADHIKPYSKIISENKINTVKQAKLCDQLWDISNGRTLFIKCHQATETFGSKSIIK